MLLQILTRKHILGEYVSFSLAKHMYEEGEVNKKERSKKKKKHPRYMQNSNALNP